MPFDPITITWLIGSFVAGALVGAFWDEITEWFNRVVEAILDAINLAVNVTSDAIIYLVKEGTRVYKRIEIYSKNIYTNNTKLHSEQELVNEEDIPTDLQNQLNAKKKVKLAQKST